MTTRSVGLLTILALAAAPAAVVAENGQATSLEALKLNKQVAECLVKRERRSVERVLASLPQSEEARNAYVAAHPQNCLRGGPSPQSLTMPGHFWRGALAEELLVRDFLAVGKPAGSRSSAVFERVAPDVLQGLSDLQRREIVMINFAECVVSAEPLGSFAVFRTDVGSAEEKEAMRSLSQSFAICTPAGETLTLRIPVVRSFLAEGAYRVSVAQASAAAGAVAPQDQTLEAAE